MDLGIFGLEESLDRFIEYDGRLVLLGSPFFIEEWVEPIRIHRRSIVTVARNEMEVCSIRNFFQQSFPIYFIAYCCAFLLPGWISHTKSFESLCIEFIVHLN